MTPSAKATRLRVFRAVKAWMEEHGECPTSVDVARITKLGKTACYSHMKALADADGLPMPIRFNYGGQRKGERRGGNVINFPVDVVMASNTAARAMGW